jgi:hypothetical protein
MTTAPAPTPDASTPLRRRRRWAVRALLAGATLLLVVSVFALWANRQVLDADNWADTSTALLENPEIRTQVSGFLVDQVYDNVDVGAEIGSRLPPRFQALAGPAANALRDPAQRTMERALARPRLQQAWKEANRLTAQQFINIAEGNSSAVTSSGNAVILDLRVLVTDLATRIGLPRGIIDKIPPDAGRIKIMSSSDVSALQNGVSALRGLAAVLPGLAIAMFALAVYLARGRRRETLMWAGLGFIVAGIVVLVGRRAAGGYVVDSLTSTDAVKPAAEAAWSIGTQMLRDVAQASVVIGIPVVAAAWLAGPQRPAAAIRRTLAPSLRDRPGVSYGVLALLLLLVIAWGPIPATRMVLPVLVMTGLAVAGLAALRRQTAAEFPEATAGSAGDALAGHAARMVQSARGGPGATVAVAPSANAAAAGAPTERLEQLERLATLHHQGALSDEEFAAEKTAVLHNGSTGEPG